MPQNNVYLSLGSNLGDREQNISRAIRLLSEMEGFELIRASSIYITEPVDMDESAPTFFNLVVKGQFKFTPAELLSNIEKIEEKLGRSDKGNYQPRTIDIDILLFGTTIVKNEKLTIPHDKMTRRPFVLVPLLQIEPDLIFPVSQKRLDSYISQKEKESLILYKDFDIKYVRT
ncbi:MAG: 2-amino-4-hydroxy-6-hydroxymethyldihydropteridine diphosphokinase [Candidatus Zixiibacteriota bacterium]